MSSQSAVRASTTAAASKRSPSQSKVRALLDAYPDYQKTLNLAVEYEEANGVGSPGWQWADVQTHPTKLMRLVIEGIVSINSKTRNTSRYLLSDRQSVKDALSHNLSS